MLNPIEASRIADEFDLGDQADLSGPIARGELGQIWRLQTSRGPFAIKEWFKEVQPNELSEGAAFQETARAAGVPCPAVFRRRDGSLLAEASGSPVGAYGWVDLQERDSQIDPEGVGAIVGALHRVAFAGSEPLDPWYSDPIGRDRWDELVGVLRHLEAPFAERLAQLRDELIALETLMAPPSTLRTCHRDLWAENLRATQDGSLCLIDWDNAGEADPSMELALVLFEFGRSDAGRARTLADAYADAGGSGKVHRPSDFSMPIAQLGHIGERQCRLWMAASTDEDRERAALGVWEFVDESLSRELIDHLLDAIS